MATRTEPHARQERIAALAWGKWLAEEPAARYRGYHISAMYSIWEPLAGVVERLRDAKARAQRYREERDDLGEHLEQLEGSMQESIGAGGGHQDGPRTVIGVAFREAIDEIYQVTCTVEFAFCGGPELHHRHGYFAQQ